MSDNPFLIPDGNDPFSAEVRRYLIDSGTEVVPVESVEQVAQPVQQEWPPTTVAGLANAVDSLTSLLKSLEDCRLIVHGAAIPSHIQEAAMPDVREALVFAVKAAREDAKSRLRSLLMPE